jgi:hypothetical protein
LSAFRSASERLLELERIIARDRATQTRTGRDGADPVAVHLTSVPADRIRDLTESLKSNGTDPDNDAVDILTMRLLLNDFATAVEHLRGIAAIAATMIDNAAKPVRESQRLVKHEDTQEEKRRLQRSSEDDSTDD